MTKLAQRSRILRNYRNVPPGRFHAFNQRVRNSLTDKSKISDVVWGTSLPLISSYVAVSDKYDPIYQEAAEGSRVVIAQRDVLQAQIVDYLDEIASILEAAAVRNPDILIVSGFDLAKERRARAKHPAPDSNVEQESAPTTD